MPRKFTTWAVPTDCPTTQGQPLNFFFVQVQVQSKEMGGNLTKQGEGTYTNSFKINIERKINKKNYACALLVYTYKAI